MRSVLVALILLAGSGSLSVRAETVYIQDVIFVPLRGGPGDEYRIINRGIRSGTALELLQTDPDKGFSQVRTENGTEGWLRSQYVSREKIARDQLVAMQQRLSTLQQRHDTLIAEISSHEASVARLEAVNNTLDSEAENLRQQLAEIQNLAADTLRIHEENRQLNDRMQLLQDELDTLTQLNARLTDRRNQQWFLAGALTLFMGMLPGYWFARRIYNRRSSGWV